MVPHWPTAGTVPEPGQDPKTDPETDSKINTKINLEVGSATDQKGNPDDLAHQAAAAYLRELLLRPGRIRRTWEQHAERSRRGQVNQLAVAEVLARHLWENPRRPGDTEVLARQLKDTASRALSGKLLSRATLALFIEAFRLPPDDCEHLWRLWESPRLARVLSGPRAMAPDAVTELATVLGPPGHQTVSLHDHMRIGPDGNPVRARTLQVIEATRDGLDHIPYLYDTYALTLEVGPGCKDPGEPLVRIRDGLYATKIPLAKTLDKGETLSLEYWTSYHYPHDQPKDRQYRRAVMRRVENLDIRVEFDPEMLPATLWWASWDGIDGRIAEQQPAELDSQHSAHRYLRLVEKTVVGFHWEWPGGA